MKHKSIHVAVIGCPNSGKSTLINMLAGSKLKVGNWPGVTVEKHEAILHEESTVIRLIDLPGAYSILNATAEEKITQNYLLNHRPDVVVNVVDATQMERHLGLTFQLLEFGIPMILVLSMMDEAKNLGQDINTAALAEILGVSVVPLVATRTEGRKDLIHVIQKVERVSPRVVPYSEEVEQLIDQLPALVLIFALDEACALLQAWDAAHDIQIHPAQEGLITRWRV